MPCCPPDRKEGGGGDYLTHLADIKERRTKSHVTDKASTGSQIHTLSAIWILPGGEGVGGTCAGR